MKHALLHSSAMTILLSLGFTACSSDHSSAIHGGYTYSGIYFGKNLSTLYKKGIHDGCETAKGYYTKSHTLFNTEIEYYHGWFRGRNKCRFQRQTKI